MTDNKSDNGENEFESVVPKAWASNPENDAQYDVNILGGGL